MFFSLLEDFPAVRFLKGRVNTVRENHLEKGSHTPHLFKQLCFESKMCSFHDTLPLGIVRNPII